MFCHSEAQGVSMPLQIYQRGAWQSLTQLLCLLHCEHCQPEGTESQASQHVVVSAGAVRTIGDALTQRQLGTSQAEAARQQHELEGLKLRDSTLFTACSGSTLPAGTNVVSRAQRVGQLCWALHWGSSTQTGSREPSPAGREEERFTAGARKSANCTSRALGNVLRYMSTDTNAGCFVHPCCSCT